MLKIKYIFFNLSIPILLERVGTKYKSIRFTDNNSLLINNP